jgi:gamma-glutamyl-gamma-aminobutyrate hydrolase PuuD
MTSVYIHYSDDAYNRMFTDAGWDLVDNIKDADLVQFTGGEDVTPALYEEPEHRQTYCNPVRDKQESTIFFNAHEMSVPMAGICRGGQFLNVMCGGKLFQHVDNHATGQLHDMTDLTTGAVIKVTSTHHQMMRPGPTAEVLAYADISRTRESMKADNVISMAMGKFQDTEAVLYKEDRVLCFQPHPEYLGSPAMTELYFDYLKLIMED